MAREAARGSGSGHVTVTPPYTQGLSRALRALEAAAAARAARRALARQPRSALERPTLANSAHWLRHPLAVASAPAAGRPARGRGTAAGWHSCAAARAGPLVREVWHQELWGLAGQAGEEGWHPPLVW
jgi:hypothetical protein